MIFGYFFYFFGKGPWENRSRYTDPHRQYINGTKKCNEMIWSAWLFISSICVSRKNDILGKMVGRNLTLISLFHFKYVWLNWHKSNHVLGWAGVTTKCKRGPDFWLAVADGMQVSILAWIQKLFELNGYDSYFSLSHLTEDIIKSMEELARTDLPDYLKNSASGQMK